MKILCAPEGFDFNSIQADLKVVLFGRSNKKEEGEIGLDIWEKIRKAKFNPDSKAWDIVSIALSVMAADLAGHRKKSPDGWTREFELLVAVNDNNFWDQNRQLLEKQLGFLTSDRWKIFFLGGGFSPAKFPLNEVREPKNDSIVLLSGGLDSFIGLLDLVAQGYNPFAVSHLVIGDAEKQSRFASLLNLEKFHIQFNHNAKIPNCETPPSQRARSIIFLAYGVLMASCLKAFHENKNINLFMCENGYISLNPPLTNIRIGSLSTRTTHPVFIGLFQKLLDNAGVNVKVINPYQFKTKGEMLMECKNQKILSQFAHETTSCGRFKRYGFKHCGRCIPCLIRRASFKAWGKKDKTSYVFENLSINDMEHSRFDDVQSAAMAIATIQSGGFDEWLGAHLNSTILENTSNYKDTIRRGLFEVEQFLKSYKIL